MVKVLLQNNFSAVNLMAGRQIQILSEGKVCTVHIPTLEELNGLIDYGFFFGICATSLEELLQQMSGSQKIESKLELAKAIVTSANPNIIVMLNGLGLCLPGFKIDGNRFLCGEATEIEDLMELDDEMFDTICDYISVGCGFKRFEFIEEKRKEREEQRQKTPEELEWERREKMLAKKIAGIKQRGGATPSLEVILASIMHEYRKGMSEILQMNMYTIYFLYEQVQKIAGYRVNLIAAGNGLLDKKNKHKYWTSM